MIFGCAVATRDEEASSKFCSVFVHINKSGGSTVKAIMLKYLVRRRRVGLCSEPELVANGCHPPRGFVGSRVDCWHFIGDSTSVLRSWIPHCAYVTMFRRPETRLVSAYHYCKRTRSDHLCGTVRLDARNATLQQWAQHQRGFVYLRLALGSKMPHHRRLDDHDDDDDSSHVVPTWIRLQGSLKSDATDDVAFAKVVRTLRDGILFDAVGILENLKDTARAFDAVVPLRHPMTWRQAFQLYHVNDGSRRRSDRAIADDPAIHAALDYDYPLYHAAEVALQRRVATFPASDAVGGGEVSYVDKALYAHAKKRNPCVDSR